MSKRSLAFLWLGLALAFGLVLGSWAERPASALSEGGLEEMVQSLNRKVDGVLKNQEAIIKQLDRIWKYK